MAEGAQGQKAGVKSPVGGEPTLSPEDDATLAGPRPAGHSPVRPHADSGTTPLHAEVAAAGAFPSSAADYEILGMLGRGGMAVVYKARQVALKRLVALKMILGGQHAGPEERIRFQIEAEAVAGLQHPHIVQVYEVGTRDGFPFLALEYLGGGSLQQRLRGELPSPDDAARLIQQLAAAVHFAHQRGIVHRDLKPGNILFSDQGTPKLVDFGLAKRLDADDEHTHAGSLLGTPVYMAPEQTLDSSQSVGPATDIYGLGAVFYHLLAGRPLFQAQSVGELLDKVRFEEPVPPRSLNPKVPHDLQVICLKCLRKEPAQRYGSAEELALDLERYLQGEPIRARPVSLVERSGKWMKRHPALAGLLALSMACVVGLFAWVWNEWRRADAEHRAEVEARKQERIRQAVGFMQFINEVRAMYASEIVARVSPFGIDILPDYKTRPKAIPVWATFVHELSARLEKQDRVQYTRLYSDYPFPWRKDGGPRDPFEVEALAYLRAEPAKAFYRFEDYKGRPSLRYAAADRMHEACIKCHNTHPQSAKKDWKVGDVRGVLEVILPLE